MNSGKLRAILLAGTALVLAATAAQADQTPGAATPPSTPAAQPSGSGPQAPSADTDKPDKVEKVTVTARRTGEALQKVPGSVTAVTEKSLDRLGATDVTGLQGAIPNMNIEPGRGSSNATNIYIRGVGQPDALQTFDPAIGFYVDDVYYSRIRGTQFDLLDIDRLEILRGPQGTLYGKNTIGGAIKIITRRPGQEIFANGSLTLGSYNEFQMRGTVSGPLSDTFAASLSALYSTRDGYVTSPVTGEDYNDRNAEAARLKFAWDPSDAVRVDVAVDYTEEDNALVLGQATNTLTTILGVPLLVLPPVPPTYDYHTTPTSGLPNSTELTHWGGSAAVNWQVNDAWSLSSITAYRELSNDDYVDIDATPLELGDVFVGVDQDQTSQELQAIYSAGPLTVVGGLYYLRENITSHQEAYADDFVQGFLGATSFTRTVDDDLQTTSQAAYANAIYALTPKVNVSGGLRYTDETKNYFRTTSTFSNQPLLVGTFAFQAEETWNDLSPMASIDYSPDEDTMLYARYAKGFKSGGFNGRANNPGEDQPYDPETLTSYEAGLKADWADDRIRTNLAVFYNDYKDFQARVSRIVTSQNQPVPAADFAVINAGGLTTYGAELEATAFATKQLRFDAAVGYLHADYDEFFEVRIIALVPTTIDRSWQTPAFSPEWTVRLGGQYEWPLGDLGSLTLGGAARFRSEMALAVDNASLTTHAIFPGMWQDDYWVYDAQLVWSNISGSLLAGIYGRNLSDEVYKTDAQEFSSVGGIRTAYYGAPMTVSFKITARY